MKGAVEVVLRQCLYLPDGSSLTSVDKEHFEAATKDLSHRGLRGQRSEVTCDRYYDF